MWGSPWPIGGDTPGTAAGIPQVAPRMLHPSAPCGDAPDVHAGSTGVETAFTPCDAPWWNPPGVRPGVHPSRIRVPHLSRIRVPHLSRIKAHPIEGAQLHEAPNELWDPSDATFISLIEFRLI